ncbi:MAG: sigma-54-dependent Fis family transcriptional regulator [Rhodospirillaceae bacterium]|nr:sigma-54-dependent Fis family transcriptional regulator [Rhodospirillaceae bacterium]
MAHDILIVDDEADICSLVSGILQDEGFETSVALNDIEAINSIEQRIPSLVLLDIWLQGSSKDGLEILSHIKKRHPTLPVVMMSGHGTIETAVKAIKQGAFDFIEKPFKTDRMILLVERAIENARLRRENEELRLRTDVDGDLIGTSGEIKNVLQSIERVAQTNSRILVSGPSGSGKEVAARMLHDRSARSSGPFVVVNCATMEPGRMEEELFGVEAHADDDEGGRKIGYFEAAHKGTLFLDEVTDMPLETQGKIVRVLQEQIFSRVGSQTKVQVDVRVVSSASKNIQDEVAAGNLREDLFYRLSVVNIDMPPLNNRREDIPALAAYFLSQTGRRTGQPVRALSEDAVATLQAYDWPGNVRELKNVMERLMIMVPGGAGDAISADDLPSDVTGSGDEKNAMNDNSMVMGMALRDAREQFERDYLSAQITRFGGNISKTAEFVGMERSALHRKLKSLGVGSS